MSTPMMESLPPEIQESLGKSVPFPPRLGRPDEFDQLAALHFFNACGIESWRQTQAESGIIGAPLIGASAKFVNSATYPEVIEVDTTIAEIKGKSFVLKHVIRRGETVLAEGEEKRIFAIEDPADPKRIKAVAIPDSLLAQWQ
ncbi:MAG: hypothetical protein Q8O52_29910 [Sulfuritalea sp.]|nr:hypothetical protein [Sulfuritalea sp.]